MGEDLFWAIRGGRGNTFGHVLAWKAKLVDVPEKATVFTIDKTLEHNATKLEHKWQYVSPKLHQDMFIRILIHRGKSSEGRGNNKQLLGSFNSMLLGGIDQLLLIMKESFPELGLTTEDCIEMSWAESTLYFAGLPRGESLDGLKSRGQMYSAPYSKIKSDFVHNPISESELEKIWNFFHEDEAELARMILIPYGGKWMRFQSMIFHSHIELEICTISNSGSIGMTKEEKLKKEESKDGLPSCWRE